MKIGWWGTNTKTRKDLLNVVKQDYSKDIKILDTCDRKDHSWILYKHKNLVSAECIFVNYESNGYSYKPIPIEDGPIYNDIPIKWFKHLTTPEERKKQNNCFGFFEQWYNESKANIKNNYEY